MNRYELDPDFRRVPPTTGAYCVRCQKPIKDIRKAIEVTVDWDNWTVVLGGSEWLGASCWKKISNN